MKRKRKHSNGYDSAAALKTKTQKELIVLRDSFSSFIDEHPNASQQFITYLSMIELEIASRIGKK